MSEVVCHGMQHRNFCMLLWLRKVNDNDWQYIHGSEIAIYAKASVLVELRR